MVTALVPTRGWVKVDGVNKPFQKLAWKWREGVNRKEAKFSTEYLELLNPADGDYQEAVVVGSGALIFDIALLGNLEKPWFREAKPDDDGYRPANMDTGFCWRLVTEAGGRMLADCTINVYHLDVFPIDESYGDRFADWPERVANETLVNKVVS